MFTVLPFGLSPSPFVFTKLLRPLVKYWRLHGLFIVVYIDDSICTTIGLEETNRNSKFVRDTLIAAGLVPDAEKSNWEPSQTSEWLGIITDTHKGVLFLPKRRIESLTTSISNVLSNFCSSSARSLARVTGKIISMQPVVGSISRLMTIYLYSAIDSGKSWDSPVDLLARPEVLQELQFWENNINSLNVKKLFEYTPPSILSFSDASSTGCGTILSLDNMICHKNWSSDERLKSSTWRELTAVHLGLDSFKKFISCKSYYWFSDNQSAVHIIENGSKKLALQAIAIDIFGTCLLCNISLIPRWIPRDKNQTADVISKLIDYDDWFVANEVFYLLDSLWGPYTVNRFADEQNTKLKRFNSLFWSPNCEAVDAFSQNWQGENNWIVPPVFLISSAIKHLLTCRARGTLVAPAWPSVPFWPLIFLSTNRTHSYVTEIRCFEDPSGIFHLGNYRKSLLDSEKFKSPVLVVKLDASGLKFVDTSTLRTYNSNLNYSVHHNFSENKYKP